MVPRVERRFLSTFIVDRHTYISYVTIYFCLRVRIDFQGDSDFMSRENCELVIRRIYVMPRLGHVYFLHDLASMP